MDSKQLNKMESQDNSFKKLTFKEKFNYILKNVTVEPMLALYIMVRLSIHQFAIIH